MKLITYNIDGHRIVYVHPEVKDKILSEGLSWNVDTPPSSETFIIDIEFLDMKTICSKKGERYSIWGYNYYDNFLHKESNATLVRMLKENIYTDITINVSNESIKAHCAVLASRSPVFSNIFSNDLKENRLSTIDISDMTFEVCQVFINYIYGNINIQKFQMHRIDLLHAAHKYDISDLKEACHESIVQDIDCSNVLQRLQIASMYRLEKLEMNCIQHLVRFEKLHDIKDDFMVFLEGANGDLKSKIFHEILNSWRRFR